MLLIAEGFIAGTLLGLFLRPVLDAYLSWKTAQAYRRLDDAQKSRHGTHV